jgi:hypothetical protein
METNMGNPQREGELTKQIERYTAAIPSSAFLTVALGAMAASLIFEIAGKGKWGNFVAQWVPTWLLFGLYNKLVKLEGHDADERWAQPRGSAAEKTYGSTAAERA